MSQIYGSSWKVNIITLLLTIGSNATNRKQRLKLDVHDCNIFSEKITIENKHRKNSAIHSNRALSSSDVSAIMIHVVYHKVILSDTV